MKNKLFASFLLIFTCFHVVGQLCTGSLGDPVMNITFGNYYIPNGPLKPGVTNLKYNTGCPNDGEYTITNLIFGCFNNTWYLLAGDHTTDVDGRFMLINASVEPSDFYVDTVKGLCGNTVYEFAAWVANVLKPTSCGGVGIMPNLTFRIETTSGTVLQKFDSGDIPTQAQRTWEQYGTFFSTPAGIENVVLRLSNNAKGGCGNDFILDDITLKPCGPKITAHEANDTSKNISFCENDKKVLHFTASYSSGMIDPVLQWQSSIDTGKTWVDIAGEQNINFTLTPGSIGLYEYRVVIAERSNFNSSQCRIASNVTTITINPVPVVPTYTTVLGCLKQDLTLTVLVGAIAYQWSGPNGFSSSLPYVLFSPVLYQDSGMYISTFKTDLGCTIIDTSYVTVYPGVTAIVSPDIGLCEGNSIQLTASGGTVFSWTPSTGLSDSTSANPVASPVDTVTYKVLVSNQYGCKDSGYVLINVYKRLVVNAGPDKTLFEGDSVTLNGSITGTPVNIYWLPNTFIRYANTATPVVNPVNNTTYILSAVSGPGCPVQSDAVFVRVYKKLKIPNIFSPNGDGINDTWVIQNLDTYPQASVKVFSRNGQVVFEVKANGVAWDGTLRGKPLPLGTYYYIIDLNIGIAPLSGWVVIMK